MTMDDIRKEAFEKAQSHYREFHNTDHERIRPWGNFDEAYVVRYGRLWLLSLVLIDFINNTIDPGGPSFDDMIDDAFTADFDRVLEGMYG